VVLYPSKDGIRAAQAALEDWLVDMGLTLNRTKTRITHTLHSEGGQVGFNFLGFHVRQYPVGKYHSGTSNGGRLLGFKTFIKPSKDAIKGHMTALGAAVRRHQGAPQEALIECLNRIIRGWTNYYKAVVAKDAFSTCDHLLYAHLRQWARHRHPTKGHRWIAHRYWKMQPGAMWDFVARKDGHIVSRLHTHVETPIQRHVKVRGHLSPFDGNLLYWAQRLADHPLTRSEEARLLRAQHGICGYCGLRFRDDDHREVDHHIPRACGGSDRIDNKEVLHRHCHDQKTTQDRMDRRL
jgi:RNA-directed DNA polymerase